MRNTPQNADTEKVKECQHNLVEAMLDLNGQGRDGIMMKTELYLLGRRQAAKLNGEEKKYVNLLVLALISPESDIKVAPKVDARLAREASQLKQTVIKVGVNVAQELQNGKDDEYLEVAERVLVNASQHGDEATRKKASVLLEKFFKTDKEPAKEVPTYADELHDMRETLRADSLFLKSGYPDPTSPQSMYIDQILDAVRRTFNPYINNGKRDEVEVALRQIINCGKREVLEQLFTGDEFTIKRLQRNVENALLYAFLAGEDKVRTHAEEALLRMRGERVERKLQQIARKYGDREIGEEAALLIASIRVTESAAKVMLPPPPPSRRKRPEKPLPRPLARVPTH